MEGEGNTGTGSTGESSTPQIPEGQTLVSKAELEALQAKLAGFQEAGFESADQVRPWAPVLSTAAKANLTPEQLSKLLAGEGQSAPQPKPGDDKPLTALELQSMLDAREVKVHRSLAEQNHQQLIIQQAGDLQKQLGDVFGDALTDGLKATLIEGYMGKYDAMRSRASYPVGHPLHGEFNPALSPDKVKAIIAEAKAEKEKMQAHQMGRIANAGANARNTGQPYTPQPSGQGDFSRLSATERIKAEIQAKIASGRRG